MMDVMVLAAQEWVNATYAEVDGYVACAEDGKTGWKTMHSLTRALQHELGITNLADGFGPATLSRLAARGGVHYGDSNANIVKITQSSCYCHGYNPGGITGTFGDHTRDAILELMLDAGILDRYKGAIEPKVMKGLMSMDAYKPLSGASMEVRRAQKALNRRYLDREEFFLVPWDGLFSRNTLKSLVYSIQYEEDMSDSMANGVFGPETQRRMKSASYFNLTHHPLQVGDSGILVELFSASLVFNGYGVFTDTYTSQFAGYVESFQRFCALEIGNDAEGNARRGKGDFTTWAEMLISTGDVERKGTAVDCVDTITPARALTLRNAPGNDFRYIGRYLDQRASLDKRIKPGEIGTIFENGFRLFPISQYAGHYRDYFKYSQGVTDGRDAHNAAVGYGIPKGTIIYFAVDYDATQQDIDDVIIPYFRGVVAGLAQSGRRYVHGVYGSRNVCAEVSLHTNARASFVSGMSTGFSGNKGFKLPANWSFNQILTMDKPPYGPLGTGDGKIEVDKVIHKPNSDEGIATLTPVPDQMSVFLEYIDELYDLAVTYSKAKPALNPDRKVLDYLRGRVYNDARWGMLFGWADSEFVHIVDSSGVMRREFVREPFYSLDLQVSHIAAVALGVGGFVIPEPALGDLAGWGGDSCTFYGEWFYRMDGYASGFEFCMDRLANTGAASTFNLSDACEDADGFVIGNALNDGANISEAFRAQYERSSAGRPAKAYTRFRNLLTTRFGGTTTQDVSDGLRDWLLGEPTDPVMVAVREMLMYQTAKDLVVVPSLMPGYKIDPFYEGFGTVFSNLAAAED